MLSTFILFLPTKRNFAVHSVICKPGDMLLMGSDGFHDNLDPQSLGKTPFELGVGNISTGWEVRKGEGRKGENG